jgi:hypothetical protein
MELQRWLVIENWQPRTDCECSCTQGLPKPLSEHGQEIATVGRQRAWIATLHTAFTTDVLDDDGDGAAEETYEVRRSLLQLPIHESLLLFPGVS